VQRTGTFASLYLLIKEGRFLPLFFVRFLITYNFVLKLPVLPPFSERNGSCGRAPDAA
jgi:hypothetical protein